ncbi:MAG: DUF211 domain-containing protein [Thermoproteota archaeon]
MIDGLKPREITIVSLSKTLCSVSGVEEVSIVVTEVDTKTETVKLTITGSNIDYDSIVKAMSENSTIVRSIDEVTAAKIKSARTTT